MLVKKIIFPVRQVVTASQAVIAAIKQVVFRNIPLSQLEVPDCGHEPLNPAKIALELVQQMYDVAQSHHYPAYP